jgi:hypothetical protein
MFIKQPSSNNALESVRQLIDEIVNRIQVCANGSSGQSHDFLSLLYISSYTMSKSAIKSAGISRALQNIMRSNAASNVICVVRVPAPPIFRNNMKNVLERAINELKSAGCYVKTFNAVTSFQGTSTTPSIDIGFINHAKFIVFYHFCFSENVYYHAKYYGSTNITIPGLATYASGMRLGNYEEFYVSQLGLNHLQNLILEQGAINRNRTDKRRLYRAKREIRTTLFYVNEMYDIVKNRNSLYYVVPDPSLRPEEYIHRHIQLFNNVIERIRQQLIRSNTMMDGGGKLQDDKLVELYTAYINSQVLFLTILSFIYDLPGAQLTKRIIDSMFEELHQRHPKPIEAPNPALLEMLIVDMNHNMKSEEQRKKDIVKDITEIMHEVLSLKPRDLSYIASEFLKICKEALEKLRNEYLAKYDRDTINRYYDEVEKKFVEFIERNGKNHVDKLHDLRQQLLKSQTYFRK